MKIYTSYFNNANFLSRNNIVMVGICRFPPKDLKYNIYEVAPSVELLLKYKEDLDKTYYVGTYLKQIRNIDIAKFMKDIEAISYENDGKDIALCCFEKPLEFCHRHLLAEFMNTFGLAKDVHEISSKDVYISSLQLF